MEYQEVNITLSSGIEHRIWANKWTQTVHLATVIRYIESHMTSWPQETQSKGVSELPLEFLGQGHSLPLQQWEVYKIPDSLLPWGKKKKQFNGEVKTTKATNQ